ncbi:MAG: hypothetical protein ABIQ73_02740 [Acidimicrobiales bacterium]
MANDATVRAAGSAMMTDPATTVSEAAAMSDFKDLPDDERTLALIRVAHMLVAEMSENDIDRLAAHLDRANTPRAAADLVTLRWLTETDKPIPMVERWRHGIAPTTDAQRHPTMNLRRLPPREFAQCCYCLRDIATGELHWHDSTTGDLWCVDCDGPEWHHDVDRPRQHR